MKKALLFSLAALAVGAAQAQNFVGMEVGMVKADLSDLASDARALYAASGLPASVSTDDSASSFRVFGGASLNPMTRIELGYFNTGDVSVQVSGNYLGFPFEEKLKYASNGLDVSVLLKPFDSGFYLKGGVHASKVDAAYTGSVAGFSLNSESHSESGIGALYGLGYEVAVAEDFNLRASFVRYQKLGGEADIDLDMVSLGLSKRF